MLVAESRSASTFSTVTILAVCGINDEDLDLAESEYAPDEFFNLCDLSSVNLVSLCIHESFGTMTFTISAERVDA